LIRSSGLLLHLTSLPGPHGTGGLGPEALRFLDFLAAAGQSWWQMLPVNPPDGEGCPYSGPSVFAGSPLLISLQWLQRDGLLGEGDLAPEARLSETKVDYTATAAFRVERLRRAYRAFRAQGGLEDEAFRSYCAREREWLDDFAIFAALKRRHPDRSWLDWPPPLRDRHSEALAAAREEFRDEIDFERFVQFVFERQWDEFAAAVRARGIGLIGDLPIFVSHDSADVWGHRRLFRLDRAGRPRVVSGAPPDAFNADGQFWGHPLYRWSGHRTERHRWWTARSRRLLHFFDVLRLDHFLGYARLWAVRASDRTARNGRWTKGPGAALLARLCDQAGADRLIAEDLGAANPQADALRERFGLPGMRVLQFAFDDPDSPHAPGRHVRHSVVYTGTHDNDTALGWFEALPPDQRQRVRAAIEPGGAGFCWDFVAAAFGSIADLAIVPVQDVLCLGSDARMNRPGTATGNWAWRLPPAALGDDLARRLRELTARCQRLREHAAS
jgi:4-alpha-glucanotransferase